MFYDDFFRVPTSLLLIFSLTVSVAVSSVVCADAFDVAESTWDGFGEDFDPYWIGETKRVNWSRYRSSSGSLSIFGGFGGAFGPLLFEPQEYRPIELRRSSRSAGVDTEANVYVSGRHVTADSGSTPVL